MKKRVLLLVILISVLFACSSDDDTDSNDPTGTYTLTSAKTSRTIDADADGTFDDTELMGLVNCLPKIILNADNSAVIDSFSLEQSNDYDDNGAIIVNPVICQQYSAYNVSYSITDGSLVITDGQDNAIWSISENIITRIDTGYYFYASSGQYEEVSVTFTFTK